MSLQKNKDKQQPNCHKQFQVVNTQLYCGLGKGTQAQSLLKLRDLASSPHTTPEDRGFLERCQATVMMGANPQCPWFSP